MYVHFAKKKIQVKITYAWGKFIIGIHVGGRRNRLGGHNDRNSSCSCCWRSRSDFSNLNSLRRMSWGRRHYHHSRSLPLKGVNLFGMLFQFIFSFESFATLIAKKFTFVRMPKKYVYYCSVFKKWQNSNFCKLYLKNRSGKSSKVWVEKHSSHFHFA